MSDTARTRSVNLPRSVTARGCCSCQRSYHGVVRPGTRVEVRSRFESRWSRGFEVADMQRAEGRPVYKVKRRSDGSILPALFAEDDVREERRRGTWWI